MTMKYYLSCVTRDSYIQIKIDLKNNYKIQNEVLNGLCYNREFAKV